MYKKHDDKTFREFAALLEGVKRAAGSRITVSADEGITPLWLFTLGHLRAHPGSSAQGLAEQFNLSSSSVAQLTRRMTAEKLLTRRIDATDHRIVRFLATKKGLAVFSRFHREHIRKVKKIFRLIPENDLQELIRIFKNLLNAIKKSA